MKRLTFCLALLTLAATQPAFATPAEVLSTLKIDPSDPKHMLLRYDNAGGGMFVTQDGGKSFRMLCNSGADPSIARDVSANLIMSDGTIAATVFDNMWMTDKNLCGWSTVGVFKDYWVNAFALDTRDVNKAYALTSSGGKQNGIYKREGSGDWEAFGMQEDVLLANLLAAKLAGDKQRFYEVTVRGWTTITDPDTGDTHDQPNYGVRYSDDDAQSWTETALPLLDGYFSLLAVDPSNPDHLFAVVRREDPGIADDIMESTDAGTKFAKIGQVTAVGGAVFANDGRFFYGDIDQDTPSLYVVEKSGAAPKQLADTYKAGCLTFDADQKNLYVCQDRLFGTVDPATGKFTTMFDITMVEDFVSCQGFDAAAACQSQLVVGYCGIGHYPQAPLCSVYGLVTTDAGVGSAGSSAGPGGSGGTGGTAGTAGKGGAAGSSGSSGKGGGSAGTAGGKSDSGCSCNLAHSSRHASPVWLVVGLAVLVLRTRRRRSS